MSVLRGPGHGRPDEDREAAVEQRVAQMLSSPEALMEGIARSEVGEYAGPDADARFARLLREQTDPRLSALGRALERGERPADLLGSDELSSLRRDADRAGGFDPVEVVRGVAEHDRALRRD